MFTAIFQLECDICGKKEERPRSFGEKLRVDKHGQGTFNLKPFYSWHIMELCFDRRYEMTGPNNEDMLTFKFAVCGDRCHRRLDSVLALIHEKHWFIVEKELQDAIQEERANKAFSNQIAAVNRSNDALEPF